MADTLTQQAQRLCKNCLSAVTGIYCAQCGQKQQSALRSFRQLADEFFNDVLNLDTKLLNTLKPLLFKPGFLSTEYFSERRTRYVAPFKLYVVLSVLAFFFIQISVDVGTQSGALWTAEPPQKLSASGKAEQAKRPEIEGNIINLGNGPWHAENNPINFAWLPDVGNDLINARIGKLESTIRTRDWTALIHTALSATPPALILMLPFFALLLKVMYFLQKRLYIEHMIVALHNHAFLLLAITLLLLGIGLMRWLLPSNMHAFAELVLSALSWWIPLYFLLSLKNIYRQGWRKTGLKFVFIGFFYLQLIALMLSFVLVLGIIMI